MLATILYKPGDIRCEEIADPKILQPTDAIIKLSASCICGSDLWPYRGLQPVDRPMHMGHEYCGIVVEVGSEVRTVRPGQFVVGSFCISDNTCPHCRFGFQSSCVQREFMSGAGRRRLMPVCRWRTARWWQQQKFLPTIWCRICSQCPTSSAQAGMRLMPRMSGKDRPLSWLATARSV